MKKQTKRMAWLILLMSLLIIIGGIGVRYAIKSRRYPSLSQSHRLVINSYASNTSTETNVNFALLALDEHDKPDCSAPLTLTIFPPKGDPVVLSTNNQAVSNTNQSHGSIVKIATSTASGQVAPATSSPLAPSTDCGQPQSTATHVARYKPTAPGTYQLELIQTATKQKATTNFILSPNSNITMSRLSPTFIYPNTRNTMVIHITANQNISGIITEKLPANLKVVWHGQADYRKNSLAWKVNLKSGESLELAYEYVISKPQQSSKAHTVGPVSINSQGVPHSTWSLVYQSL